MKRCVETQSQIQITNSKSGLQFLPCLKGYYLPYIAEADEPYWHYGFGQLSKAPAGSIPKGGIVHVQRPPDSLGTHQSAHLDGVGRILIRIGNFRPAPALITNS